MVEIESTYIQKGMKVSFIIRVLSLYFFQFSMSSYVRYLKIRQNEGKQISFVCEALFIQTTTQANPMFSCVTSDSYVTQPITTKL